MNVKYFALIMLFVLTSCMPCIGKKEGINDASVASSLTDINQKVSSHFLTEDIPDNFDALQYKTIADGLCSSNPVCKSQIEELFDTYNVQVRKIDDTFSVLLCDVGQSKKIMEDFGCNNMLVEIRSWEANDSASCEFEDNWQKVLQQYCAE
jgi:hypothetical protein